MMSRLLSVAAVALALVLVGCEGNKKLTLNPDSPAKTVPEVPPPVKKDAPPEANVDPRDFAVRPSAKEGYAPSTLAIASMGPKVDQGIAGLHNGWAQAKVLFDGPRGKLNGTVEVKVRDANTFLAEYLLTQTDATPHKIIADGHQKMVYENRKWSPATKSSATGTMKPAEVDQWIARFPSEMFAGLRSGEQVWTRLLAGLAADPARTTEIEQQEKEVKSVKRPIYRIVSRKKGVANDVLEIVVDGLKWLPLTVKANYSDAKGAATHVFWTARWQFGGTFEDKEFLIANNAP